jgi:hypothetical protein
LQDILCGDCFRSDSGIGKSDIFGDGPVEMVTYHQHLRVSCLLEGTCTSAHIEVLVKGVDAVWSSWVCGRGKDVLLFDNYDNIGCVTPASALGMVSDSVSHISEKCREIYV